METTEMNSPAPSTTPVAPIPVQVPPTSEKKSNLPLIIAGVLGLAILLGAGYYFYTAQNGEGEVVGVVNGEKITRIELDESLVVVRENPAAYGIDPQSPTLEAEAQTVALEILVNNALLLTAAHAAGFSAEDEKVQESYNTLVTQIGGEEALKSQLAAVGLSEDRLRDNLRDRVTVDAYLEANTDVEAVVVSAEEVDGFIESLRAGGVELPENIDDLRPQIEAEVRAQKQQQLLTELLLKLKGEAKIEVRI